MMEISIRAELAEYDQNEARLSYGQLENLIMLITIPKVTRPHDST